MAQQAATPPPAAVVGPQPAAARAPMRRGGSRQTYGALDLGTNNCRLLIARPSEGGFTVVDAFSRIVRLGEGLGVRATSLTEIAREIGRASCRERVYLCV